MEALMRKQIKSIDFTTIDPNIFADQVLEGVASNLEHAARECGLAVMTAKGKALGEWDCRRNNLHHALVEVILYLQGRRNDSVEISDSITTVANMTYFVKDHHEMVSDAIRIATDRISTTPLEAETRSVRSS